MTNGLRLAATFTLLASVNAFGWTGWHPTAWDTPRLASPEVVRVQAVTNGPFVFTNYLPQWNRVVDGVYTNYVYGWPPDGSCSTNKVISTNAFLSDIVANAGVLDTGAVVNSWSFDLTDCTGTAYTVTRTVTNYPAWTNLHLQARDVWAFDAYMAMYEREQVIQRTHWLHGIIAGEQAADKPRYYRNNREALVYTKSWLAGSIGYFVATNYIAPEYLTNTIETVTADVLMPAIAAPSNYLDHTPWRWLGPVDGGLSNVVRGSWAMVGWYDTNGVALVQTNITVDSCGNTVTNIGAYTNGQVVAFVCTNAAILAGHTESDYGWRKVTNIFANLKRINYPGYWRGREQQYAFDESYTMNGDVTDPANFVSEMNRVWNDYTQPIPLMDRNIDRTNLTQSAGWFAEVSQNYDNNVGIEMNSQVITWESYAPAIALYRTTPVTIAASSAIAYWATPQIIYCPEVEDYPCPGIVGANFPEDRDAYCQTNNLHRRYSIATTYTNNVGNYAGVQPYTNVNAVTFSTVKTYHQAPPYYAELMAGVCGYDDILNEFDPSAWGASQDEISTIIVEWNFER